MKKRWQMICICYAAVAAVLLAAGIRAITQQDKEESMKKADKKASGRTGSENPGGRGSDQVDGEL